MSNRTFSYSAAGHQETSSAPGNTVTFAYDQEGRLEMASRTGGDTCPLEYDGRSYLRQAGDLATTGTVQPTYDSSGMLHSLLRQENAAATPRRYHFFYLASRPVAQLATETAQADRWWYLTTDHLGTPVVTTAPSGTEQWESSLEPFGEDRAASTLEGALVNEQFLRFPGQWEDEVWQASTFGAGVGQNQFRWYASDTGRYSKPDPLGAEGDVHPYAYASANPLLWVDALGLRGQVGICCKALAEPLAAFRHCYFRRIDADTQEVTTIGMHTSQTTGNFIAASFLYSVSEIEVNHPFDSGGPSGDCILTPDPCDEMADCALAAAATYPSPAYYSLTGPNSNTFAGDVARQCGLSAPSVAGTWRSPGWFGVPPARFRGRR